MKINIYVIFAISFPLMYWWLDHNNTFKHKEESLGVQSGNLSSFEWFHSIVCYPSACMVILVCRVVNSIPVQQTNDFSAMYPSVFNEVFGLFIPIFCLLRHNLVYKFVIWISSMRLNETYKFHCKSLQKVFRKFLFWCLGCFLLKSIEVP